MGLFDDLVRLGDQVRVFDDFALLGFLKPRILKPEACDARRSYLLWMYNSALAVIPVYGVLFDLC